MPAIFSVKTYCITRTSGKPVNPDRYFNPDLELLEERILLVKAKTSEVAIKMAEMENEKYCKGFHLSPFGQKVSKIPIGYLDCFQLFDESADLLKVGAKVIEVFSTTELVSKRETRKKLLNRKGGKEWKNENKLRIKFLNREYSGIHTDSK